MLFRLYIHHYDEGHGPQKLDSSAELTGQTDGRHIRESKRGNCLAWCERQRSLSRFHGIIMTFSSIMENP